MSLDLLKEDIRNKNIRKLYLFSGPEEFLKKYYVESLEKILLAEEFKALNRIVLEGRQEMGKLSDYCETLPVFSDRKMIIVKNSGFFKPASAKKGDNGKKTGQPGKNEELVRFMEDLPAHVCLVFCEAEADKRMKLLETVKKNGLAVEFEYQKPDELIRWVTRKFKASGRDIDSRAAAVLVDSCEQGMTEISNEMDKLVAYTEGRGKITLEDIEKVCTKSIKGRIFDLTDAIAEKRNARAIGLLNDMIILKEPIPRIFFMIARQLRQILQAKLLQQEGCGVGEIATRMGLSSYIAGKVLKQASNFSLDKLKEAVGTALELDLAVKTGQLEDRAAVETLIIWLSN